MYQTTIFDMILPKYKITKPIRLIEFFAGYGSQALALKYLGVPFEHWKICEWAVKSIQAYKDIHFINDNFDYSQGISESELMEYLYHKGISNDYNKPMTLQQIGRIYKKGMRKIYNNIQATHNLVNIQQVKGKDLEIVDTDKYEYILTYSFPCQDLSLAGKGKGMSDTSTRSGMLWEVERILEECKELGSLPQILLMENVPQVHGEGNTNDFNKWQLKLEELGYTNYWEDLIATDYGIPQTRNRCFMVSILGEYSYSFPPKKDLKLRLKDMLEEEVDDKYYLSDKQIEDIKHWNAYEKPLENMEKIDKTNISPTRSGAYAAGMVLVKDTKNYIEWEDGKNIQMNCRAWKDDKVVATLNTGGETKILIKNATKKGYLEAQEGDGVDISSRMEYHRGTVTAIQLSNLAIRKLTPRECGRLMGVKDEDITNMLKNQSDSSAYHCFGDSIVVDVLMAIFGELL